MTNITIFFYTNALLSSPHFFRGLLTMPAQWTNLYATQPGYAPAPPPGSEEERRIFQELQAQFTAQYEQFFNNNLAPKAVLIIPSLTLDQEILRKIDGIMYYEERMLCMLMLLRMPRTHVIFVTSMPIDPVVVDYYLHMLPGITGYHARQRLTLLSCYDASPAPLTEKILSRPRLMNRILESIPDGHMVHMSCFNVTEMERTLAVRLHMPIYGCDPDLFHLGSKSNGRRLFQACGLKIPDGYEDLTTPLDIATALAALKAKYPHLQKAVVKMNEGFSGEGNATFHYPDNPELNLLDPQTILELMPLALTPVAAEIGYDHFIEKFTSMQGVVEVFLEGAIKASPSVQCRISPLGQCVVISTHDQILGGEDNQVFLGASFPANKEYAGEIGRQIMPYCEELRNRGVIGRFSVDFLSVKEDGVWTHYAIENNLRKGGTTHPYLMLIFLTDGHYNAESGEYRMKNGQHRYYFATDNLVHKRFKGLLPHDLIEIAMDYSLHFNGAIQRGVMFHMISALSQYGKIGVLAIGANPSQARDYYWRTLQVLETVCPECG